MSAHFTWTQTFQQPRGESLHATPLCPVSPAAAPPHVSCWWSCTRVLNDVAAVCLCTVLKDTQLLLVFFWRLLALRLLTSVMPKEGKFKYWLYWILCVFVCVCLMDWENATKSDCVLFGVLTTACLNKKKNSAGKYLPTIIWNRIPRVSQNFFPPLCPHNMPVRMVGRS